MPMEESKSQLYFYGVVWREVLDIVCNQDICEFLRSGDWLKSRISYSDGFISPVTAWNAGGKKTRS